MQALDGYVDRGSEALAIPESQRDAAAMGNIGSSTYWKHPLSGRLSALELAFG
jgi:hypothetical protein